MDAKTLEDLMNTWLEGWAHSRSYQPERKGRAYVIRRGEDLGVEKLVVCPNAEELAAEGSDMEGISFLTVVTQDLPAVIAGAQELGLNVRSGVETLMTTELQAHDVEAPLPPGDGVAAEYARLEDNVVEVRVTVNGEFAARGTVAVVGNVAVFDKIITEEKFRRRGLASFVMRSLTHQAQEDEAETGLLVASPNGRLLYQHLGWDEVASVPLLETPSSSGTEHSAP